MKKTPLKRKTPLQRKSELKRSTVLRSISKKNKESSDHYHASAKKEEDQGYVKCGVTGILVPIALMDRHHPFGRRKEWIKVYVYIPKSMHDWIHGHGKESRQLGWLHGPYEARPLDDRPRPWAQGSLIGEPILKQYESQSTEN